MPDIRGSSPDPRPAAIRRKLLRWYDLHHRPLPWRRTRDPYRIWLSEVMLQQTRVQTVIPFYKKFLRAFPNLKALAAAGQQTLLACWSGLGYYSRARNFQKAAQIILREHQGRFPRDLDAALRLPGVGRYTAPAVLSIAYGVPLPVVDGNVARVLSRLYALPVALSTAAGRERLQQQATALLSRKRPGDFNQALMELGATVCLPRQPECPACSLQRSCRAFLLHQVRKYPPARRVPQPVSRRLLAALVLDQAGNCLLVRRPAQEKRLAGFWELPVCEREDGRPPENRTGSRRGNNWPEGIVLDRSLGTFRHSITSNRLEVEVFAAQMARHQLPPRARWVAPAALPRLPVSTLTRKALRLLVAAG